MDNQKQWSDRSGDEKVTSSLDLNRESKAKYEVVKAFWLRGKGRVKPGDAVPKNLTDLAVASLLRKGVLKALEE